MVDQGCSGPVHFQIVMSRVTCDMPRRTPNFVASMTEVNRVCRSALVLPTHKTVSVLSGGAPKYPKPRLGLKIAGRPAPS